MAFFGKSLASRRIEIDADAVSSDCPELKKRLERIESNYLKLSDILTELEARFELDDRITSETDVDETTNIRKKKPR